MLLFLLKSKYQSITFFNRAGVCLALLLLCSCAAFSRNQGVGRIRRYDIYDERLPQKFDGFKIVFVSDAHYPSMFTRNKLENVVCAIDDLSPDVLLFGGDYVSEDVFIDELFEAFGRCNAPYGKYAILGNHDVKCVEELRRSMQRNGIKLLVDAADTLRVGGEHIYLCGVGDYGRIAYPTWLQQHADSAFTILLVHAPDYVQDKNIKNLSLALSGHTHGGQVTLFGLYAPAVKSKYGKRFLSGLNFTDGGVPVVTSNGLGTSRKNIRFCAPSDIVFVMLHKK